MAIREDAQRNHEKLFPDLRTPHARHPSRHERERIVKEVLSNNGAKIPLLGFGVYP